MSRKGGFLAGAFWGALFAGAAALLYAPKTGKELRAELSEELDHFAARAEEYRELAAERANEYRDVAFERAEEYRDLAVERGVELYDAANAKTEEIRVNLAQSAQQFKTQLDDFKQSVVENYKETEEAVSEDVDVVITEFKEALEETTDEETKTEA